MLAAARVTLASYALVAVLLLSSCGGDSDGAGEVATISSAPSTEPKQTHSKSPPANSSGPSAPAGDLCQSQLGGFIGSMDGLRRRLAVGVTYDQYVAEVRGIRSTYGEIPFEKLQIDCLAAAGAPSEKAFNRYIEGANDWGECVSELSCGTGRIEPILQRRWRIASHFLSEAQDGLRRIAK